MRARLNMHHKVLIALVALVAMGLLLAVGVWAYDDAQKDQIAPGVKIGGRRRRRPRRRLGPQDHQDAGGRAAQAAGRGQLRRQGLHAQPAAAPRARADVDGMVQEAIDRSRQGNILDRVSRYASGGKVNANLEPRVGYDKSAVKDFVNQLAGKIDQDPVNATVVPRAAEQAAAGGGPARAARSRRGQMTTAINAAAQSPGRDQAVPAGRQDDQAGGHHEGPARRPTRATSTSTASTFTLRFFHHLKLEKGVHDRGRPAGPRDPGRALPRPGQAGRPLLARPQLGLGREPRRPGDPAGPGRSAEGALDRDLRRRRHPRHRRALLARPAAPTAACAWRSRT